MDRTALLDVLENTWPPAERIVEGSLVLRVSNGGGKRVTATSITGPIYAHEIDAARAGMTAIGQPDLFTLDPDTPEDKFLEELGYEALDETYLYHCRIQTLTQRDVPKVTAFPTWPPLQLTLDIWEESGVKADRVAVMDRVKGAKTAILGRVNDRAAGAVFAAVHNGCGMIHSLEILPFQRRNGLATSLTVAAAHWAAEQGATEFALPAVAANAPANALYRSLGMTVAARYHYRIKR